jgi:hypothetical protein
MGPGMTHWAFGPVDSSFLGGGLTADRTRSLALRGRGERLESQATMDVWVHEGYAYTGTFNCTCSRNGAPAVTTTATATAIDKGGDSP